MTALVAFTPCLSLWVVSANDSAALAVIGMTAPLTLQKKQHSASEITNLEDPSQKWPHLGKDVWDFHSFSETLFELRLDFFPRK